MTAGQQRAIHELERLNATGANIFELVDKPQFIDGVLLATVAIKLGVINTRDGGLDLREREEFILSIPPDFPFDRPNLSVTHKRFAGFPHVIWGKGICLYQSSVEWNPSDGLYGLFDRLKVWLERAAMNEMDPIDGPLEPPHHNTDFTQKPFVIRADAPCEAGKSWVGLAILKKYENRIDLVSWNDLSGQWPKEDQIAFAVILPDALPMEFPSNGAELFREIEKAGMVRNDIVKNLGFAAFLSHDGEPIHLVLGLPMRRATDGSRRLHIAIWTTEAEMAMSLKNVLPKSTDTEDIRKLRAEISDKIAAIFEIGSIKWCRVLEDRNEIVMRRDSGTPFAWFAHKKILILGCGALGAWAAEMIARTEANMIHLIDNGIVKPGILARQNFKTEDIGTNKANALAGRLRAISHNCNIVANISEASAFILENVASIIEYDMILDCTASSIFQMKLERHWSRLSSHTPPFVSLIIDAQAKHCLCVVVQKGSTVGIWDAYLSFKRQLCIDDNHLGIITALYSERAVKKTFQPEPGCSDPTFVGSTADVVGIVSGALNVAVHKIKAGNSSVGIAMSAPDATGHASVLESVELPQMHETLAGNYRIRIAESVFTQARAWVRQNNRRRSTDHETGGLLWGLWDDAVQVIWVFDLSGPPPDSQHNPGRFLCGGAGTVEEHKHRVARTYGACGFVGYWHTHPEIQSCQSNMDIKAMTTLVSSVELNQKRAIMLIFGRTHGMATAEIYVYESQRSGGGSELISVGMSQIPLKDLVV